MNHKKTLGAVTNQVGGLQIRIILNLKGEHSGEFGIYAGKKLYKSFTDKAEAILVAQKSLSDKPSHYPFRSAFLKWQKTK